MNQTDILRPVKRISHLLKSEEGTHIWQFSRIGGVNRVNILSGSDIQSLKQLDQKLWIALSCPVHGLEIDAKTLELIDTDGDGRIRVNEVLAAVDWLTLMIKNSDELVLNNTSLPLSSINNQNEEGKKLLASAKQILSNLGLEHKNEISVAETSDVESIFANTQFNGDGVITEDSTENEELKSLIGDIMKCMGFVDDRSGKPGITLESIHEFYQNLSNYSDWYHIAEADAEGIWPFGESTADALEAFLAVKSKIEDYFLRCRLAEYDASSEEVFSSLVAQYETLNAKDLSQSTDEIALLPIAKMGKEKKLSLHEGINPQWLGAMKKFETLVVKPLHPKKSQISFADWESISATFDKYIDWMEEKKGVMVETLGITVVRELLERNMQEDLISLVEQDLALESEAQSIFEVDKLVRYYCDMHTLLKNFVSFSDFYQEDSKAVFQIGSLYIDQRCCDLCIKVSDMARHNTLAAASGMCLLYCECVSKAKDEKMTIVAALTDGDMDNISVGRNAIFYDRKGGDWDATIIKIIDNPISIRQAFWSPYKKLSKFVSGQIEKVASNKEKDVDSATSSHVVKATSTIDTHITQSIASKPVAPKPTQGVPAGPSSAAHQPFDIGKFVGIFAAISLALGAIGSVIISALAGFFKLVWWQMPLALIGVVLAISLPSMILAYLKLRKRNLAPVLDANGWAINAKITINILFGRTLTHLAALPVNAKVNLLDPFSKKKRPVYVVIIAVLIILGALIFGLWYGGILSKFGIM